MNSSILFQLLPSRFGLLFMGFLQARRLISPVQFVQAFEHSLVSFHINCLYYYHFLSKTFRVCPPCFNHTAYHVYFSDNLIGNEPPCDFHGQ